MKVNRWFPTIVGIFAGFILQPVLFDAGMSAAHRVICTSLLVSVLVVINIVYLNRKPAKSDATVK